MSDIRHAFKILKVDPLNKNKCCGLRKDGMPCNNIVAIASRSLAYNILVDCINLRAGSSSLKKNFREAAGLLLCKRWHQCQWSNMVQMWTTAWEEKQYDDDSDYNSVSEEDSEPVNEIPHHRTRHSTTGHGSRRSEQAPSQPSVDINLIRSFLRSNMSSQDKVALLETMCGIADSNPTMSRSRTSTTRTQNTTPTSSSFSTIADTSRNRETSATSTTSRGTPVPSNQTFGFTFASPTSPRANGTRNSSTSTSATQGDVESRRQSNNRPLTSARSSRRRLAVPSTAPPSPPSPLRLSHEECCVCLEPYAGAGADYFECTKCKNRIHTSCHRAWMQENPRVRCVHCRASA